MRIKLFITILFLSVVFLGIAQTSPLVGTWKLVSGTMVYKDSTSKYDMPTMEAMKIVTPTHFGVFSKNISTGDIMNASAGTVNTEGNNYTETITYASGTGNKYPIIAKYTYELNGDQWHIKGGFGELKLDETWQKIK